jgi:hypothetical protein
MQTTRIWRNPTEQDLSTHTTKIEDIKELNLTVQVEKYQQMLCQIKSLIFLPSRASKNKYTDLSKYDIMDFSSLKK